MAITAEFRADFSDFVKGADSATQALDQVEGKSADLGSALQDLNIERVFTDPLGAATSTLESFTGMMPPLAQAMVAVAGGLVAAGTAAYALADATATTGANLADMSALTGIEVEGLSRMANAATVAGVDVKTLERAIFDMNKRMAESPTDFAAALKSINIELADFKAMSIDQRFFAIAQAIDATTDPLTRTTAGTVLLGKSYRELAGDLGDLVTAQETVAGMPIWTAQQAADAEKFKAAVAALKLEMSGMAMQIGQELIPALTRTIELFKQSSVYQYYEGSVRLVGAAFGELDTRLRMINGTLIDTAPSVHNAAVVQTELSSATKGLALALPPLADLLRIDAEMKKEDAKASDAAAEAAKKLAKEQAAAAAAIKAGWEPVGSVLDQIFGVAALKKASDWATAMDTYVDSLGRMITVEDLSAKQLEELQQAMFAGIDALARSGQLTNEQSSAFASLAIEAGKALAALRPLVTTTEDLAKAQWDYVTAQDAALAASIKARDEAKQAADEAAAAAKAGSSGGGLPPSAIVGTGGVARDMYGRPVAGLGAISNLPIVNPMIININSPLGTPDAIAAAVGNAVTGSYSRGGQRLPV